MALDGNSNTFIPYTLNGLQEIAADAQTTTTLQVNSLTPNRVVVSDGSDFLISAGASATEVDYLIGTSSNVQTQLNTKATTAYVDSQNAAQDVVIATKASTSYVDTNFLNKTTGSTQSVVSAVGFQGALTLDQQAILQSGMRLNASPSGNWTVTTEYIDSFTQNLVFTSSGGAVIRFSGDYGWLKSTGWSPSKVPIFNAQGFLVSSGVDSGKIDFLDNVSSDIQTQLNGKLNLSGGNANQDIIIGTYKVQSSATPSTGNDYTNKTYVDGQISGLGALYVLKAGDTMTGTLAMGSNKITTSYTPVNAEDLTRKGYVDSQDALKLSLSGGTMTGDINGTSLNNLRWGRSGDKRNNLAPNDIQGATSAWYFGTYTNDDYTPYADHLILNGWVDTSGGFTNCISYNKGGKGIRQYQGTYGSSSKFSTYYDCVLTDANSADVTLTGAITANSVNVAGQTASRVCVFDASKNVVSSTVTTTTLGFLDATSSIQTQLNTLSGTFANYLPLTGGTLSGPLTLTDTSVTAGVMANRFYLSARGDNQDGTGADADGPWYGLGNCGITGFTGVPCLAGFYGLALRSGLGYLVLTAAGGVGIGVTDALTHALRVNGTTLFDGNVSLGANVITTTTNPTTNDQLTRKGYVDTQLALKANLAGGNTFTGSQTYSDQTASRVAILDASKNLTSSSVTTTTLGYLDATSSIQGQLDSKASTTYVNTQLALKAGLADTQTFSGVNTFSNTVNLSGYTASRVLQLDASKNIQTSSVTTTELGYVSGVTSGIQTQLNALSSNFANYLPLGGGVLSGTLGLTSNNIIDFGFGVTKEPNAGRIGYQRFTAGCLDITGAGTTAGDRRVFIYDKLGVGVNPANANLQVSGTAVISSNVGIGTTNPLSLLHLNSVGTHQVRFQTSHVDNHYITAANDLFAFNANLSLTGIPNTGRGSCQVILQTPTAGGFIQFLTGSAINTVPSERMRIKGDGSIDVYGNTISSTTNPSTNDHLTRKGYVDGQIATRLPLSGGILSGILTCSVANTYAQRASNPLPSNFIASSSSQRLYMGSYYTGGVGACSTIQSSDYYSSADHGTALLLNPLGGFVGIGGDPRATLDVAGDIITDWNNRRIGTQYLTTTSGYFIGLNTDVSTRTLYLDSQSSDSPATGAVVIRTGATPTERIRVDALGQMASGVTGNTLYNLKFANSLSHIDNNAGEVYLFTAYQGHLAIGRNTNRDSTTTNLVLGAAGTEEAQIISVNTDNTAYKPMSFAASRYVFTSGNMGIGTTNPAVPLHVYRASGGAVGRFDMGNTDSNYLTLNSNGTAGRMFIGMDSSTGTGLFGGGTAYMGWVGTPNNTAFGIATNNTERLRITSGGNVGIGTSNPTCKLDVRGICEIYGTATSSTSTNSYGLQHTDGTITVATFVGGGGTGGYIGTKTNHNFYIFTNDSSAQTTFKTNGYVGIGTTDPSSKFHLKDGWMRVDNGDISTCVYGPNTTWNARLRVGAATSGYDAATAQIIATNGSLHLDPGYGKDFYIGYYNDQASNLGTNFVYGDVQLRHKLTVGAGTSRTLMSVSGGTNGGAGLFGNIAAWPVNANGCLYTQDQPSGANSAGMFQGYNGANLAGYTNCLAPNVAWLTYFIYAADTQVFYNGALSAYTQAGGWVNVSDEREKEDIQDLKTESSLQRVLALRPKHYRRKYPGESATPVPQAVRETRHVGFIAQEVQKSNPHCVSTWCKEEAKCEEDDGVRLGMSYNDYVVHLVGAVQEQAKYIDVLQRHARKLEEDFNEYREQTDRRMTQLAELVKELLQEKNPPKLSKQKSVKP